MFQSLWMPNSWLSNTYSSSYSILILTHTLLLTLQKMERWKQSNNPICSDLHSADMQNLRKLEANFIGNEAKEKHCLVKLHMQTIDQSFSNNHTNLTKME